MSISEKTTLGFHLQHTEDESRYIRTCQEYFSIVFNYKQPPSAAAVKHLCAPDSQFVGAGVMPTVHSPIEYADAHADLMKYITDFGLRSYDVILAKGNLVVFRYTGCGHHNGAPYNGVPASGKFVTWHATDIFQMDPKSGLIQTMVKEWDKACMWMALAQAVLLHSIVHEPRMRSSC